MGGDGFRVFLDPGVPPAKPPVLQPIPGGGILRRSALLLILGQSLLFIAVLLITIARGLKIDCGCGLLFQRQVGLESILEDALLLGVAGWLYWREWQAGDREEKSLVLVQPKL